jgi:Tfp pilus assembly protein FimT
LGSRGFTLLELLMGLSVAMIITAVSVPVVTSSIVNYRVNNSVSMLTGAINGARYQAIYQGYPFTLTISKAAGTYQLASKKPPATAFSNVGSAVPFETGGMTLNQDTVTIQFSPSGSVTVTTGTMGTSNPLALSYKGQTRSFALTTYGKLTITKS